MVAATTVTVVSIPVYWTLYRWHGAMGLAIASDIGIALQTVSLALLLHGRRMVSLASLDFKEMGRCLLAGLASGGAVWAVFTELRPLAPSGGSTCQRARPLDGYRSADCRDGFVAARHQMGAGKDRLRAAPRGHEAAGNGLRDFRLFQAHIFLSI